jgi:hypothetical protein
MAGERLDKKRADGQYPMFNQPLPRIAGLVLGVSVMMAMPANADALRDEIAPTGKLRVAIAISPAGGAFWCTKNEAGGYAGVPVDLGKEMAAQLGVSVEYVAHQNSGQIVDAVSKGTWDVSFLPGGSAQSPAGAGVRDQIHDRRHIKRNAAEGLRHQWIRGHADPREIARGRLTVIASQQVARMRAR